MSRSPVRDSGGSPPAGSTKLYVGRLPPRTSWRSLEDLFSKYGKIVDLVIKPSGCAFLQFDDPRDAEDAIRGLNGYVFDGSRIIVEYSRRASSSSSTCFICGKIGHWVRECPENLDGYLDVKSGKCFKCGEVGHLAKHCRRSSHSPRSRSPYSGHHHRPRRSPRRNRSSSSCSQSPGRDVGHRRGHSPSPEFRRYNRYASPSPRESRYRRRSRSYERYPPARGDV